MRAVSVFYAAVYFSLIFGNSAFFRGPSSRARATVLNLDIFGLGPAEVVVIATAVAVLYGPNRLKEQLREKGIKGPAVSGGYKAEREERIALMISNADSERKRRALQRITEGLTNDDKSLTERFDLYTSLD